MFSGETLANTLNVMQQVQDKTVIACVLKRSNYLGYLLLPCYCQPDDSGCLKVLSQISSGKPPEQATENSLLKNLYQISSHLDPVQIAKKFSKNKLNFSNFFQETDEKSIQNIILPYIYKETDRLIQLIELHNIEVYNGINWPLLYPENKIALSGDKPELRLFFKRTEMETQYTLEVWCNNSHFNLQHSRFLLLTIEPCYFIVKNSMYRFDNNISGKLLKPFFTKTTLQIPRRTENEYFKKFIKKIVNHVNIEAEGFEIIDIEPLPKALLSLETDWQGYAGMTLIFDYGERKVMANNPQQTFTNLIINDNNYVFRRFRRNLNWENSLIASLRKLNLKEYGAFFRFGENDNRKNEHDFISFVSEHITDLRNLGFEPVQNFLDKYILEKPIIEINTGFKNDWFDLYITVEFGEFQIPFTRFRDNILNNEKVFVLPSLEIVILPDEWFERYTSLMLHSRVQPDYFRLHKHHFKLLEMFQIPEAAGLSKKLSETTTDISPDVQNVILRPYQLYGFLWMRRLVQQGFGFILADDMGLGKTLQVIALLSVYFKGHENPSASNIKWINRKKQTTAQLALTLFQDIDTQNNTDLADPDQCNPALIVLPASLVHNWENEIRRFAPHLAVYLYFGANRNLSFVSSRLAPLVLTTYGTVRNDIELLKSISFSFIVLDESQNIKNPYSKIAQSVFMLNGAQRIALTGTPIENNLKDIWPQFHFLNPGLLPGLNAFNRHYVNPLSKNENARQGNKLLEIIKPFILRRTKSQVEPELPELNETIIYCEMTEQQQKMYDAEKSRQRNYLYEKISGEKGNKQSVFMILKALMKLRQYANHPRMVLRECDAESGKFEAVTEILETLLAENHKVLMFSSFVSHLNIYENYCLKRNLPYAKLIGSTRKRESVIDSFRSRKEVQLFLISLKAGGTGLNITEADYVLLLDPWWNPAAEMQAISRAHRIGQNKTVFVYRFISRNTIEEKIISLQKQKSNLVKAFIIENQRTNEISRDEMIALLS